MFLKALFINMLFGHFYIAKYFYIMRDYEFQL